MHLQQGTRQVLLQPTGMALPCCPCLPVVVASVERLCLGQQLRQVCALGALHGAQSRRLCCRLSLGVLVPMATHGSTCGLACCMMARPGCSEKCIEAPITTLRQSTRGAHAQCAPVSVAAEVSGGRCGAAASPAAPAATGRAPPCSSAPPVPLRQLPLAAGGILLAEVHGCSKPPAAVGRRRRRAWSSCACSAIAD